METDEVLEETEATETESVDENKAVEKKAPEAQKICGFIVAAILIFLAQRDLRKRAPELVRGRVGVWKVVAMAPPGAVAYLIFGRRRAVPEVVIEVTESIAA